MRYLQADKNKRNFGSLIFIRVEDWKTAVKLYNSFRGLGCKYDKKKKQFKQSNFSGVFLLDKVNYRFYLGHSKDELLTITEENIPEVLLELKEVFEDAIKKFHKNKLKSLFNSVCDEPKVKKPKETVDDADSWWSIPQGYLSGHIYKGKK